MSCLEAPQSLQVVGDDDLALLRQWNKAVPSGVTRCVHDLVIEQARNQPQAPALSAWDGDLTYGDLDELSCRLASLLYERGVGPNDIVALCFEKSKWTTVAMLGTLRAGGAFVLIDTAFPLQRATAMVKQVNTKLLLGSRGISSGLKGQVPCSIMVDDDLFRRLPRPWSFPCDATPRDLAVVLFTSGSTGTPKAILQDHIAASTTAHGLGQAWKLTSKSRILQFAAYAFDMSVIDTLKALVNGACLCVPRQEDMNNLGVVIERMKINVSAVTPSVATTYPPGIERTLQTLVLGGEKVPKALIESWTKRLTVFNAYGPAEASVCSLGQAQVIRPLSIGKPINTLAWVVDEINHNALKPIGAVGELLLEGPMLAQGYLDDPENTKSSFIENPGFMEAAFGTDEGTTRRLYKSGDLVRLYPDGSLDYLGRKDLQIKLRGQRIELSEVEYHLEKLLPRTSTCVVDVIEFDTGPSLVAFIAVAQAGSMQADHLENREIRQMNMEVVIMDQLEGVAGRLKVSLKAILPAYMVPSIFLSVHKIPMTLSQKIDREALKKLGRETCMLQRFMKPEGPQTRISKGESEPRDYLHNQWEDILHLKLGCVHADSNFLQLGGNSLLAMRLASRIYSYWPASQISVRDIFENPTVEAQFQLILLRTSRGRDSPRPASPLESNNAALIQVMSLETGIDKEEVEDLREATDFQAEVISSELTEDEAEVHYCTFSFSPAVETQRLQHAVKALTSHYTIFRTCFVVHSGKLLQLVLKTAPHPLIESLNDQENGSSKQNGSMSEWEVGLRGRALYLLRFCIYSEAQRTFRMTLRISHALFDGGYDGGFLRRVLLELKALYQDEKLPTTPSFSAFCSTRLSSLPAGIEFWKGLLQDAEPSQLVRKRGPCDMRLLRNEVIRSVDICHTMPQGITPATLMKAAWALVLADILHKKDIVFGSIASGRGLPIDRADMIMGPCISTIPVRVRFKDNVVAWEVLSQVQKQYLAAIPYETVGLQTIVKRCTNWPSWEDLSTVVNDLSEENFLDQLDETIPFDAGICTATVRQNPGKWTDIAVETKKEANQMHARLYFSAKVFSTELIEELGDMLVENIIMLSSGGNRPIFRPAMKPLVSWTQFPLPPAASIRRIPDLLLSTEWADEGLIVQEAWRSNFNCAILGISVATKSASKPFYESWPLVCAYALYKFYSDKGFAVTYDDIIQHPSPVDQMWLLCDRSQKGLSNGILA